MSTYIWLRFWKSEIHSSYFSGHRTTSRGLSLSVRVLNLSSHAAGGHQCFPAGFWLRIGDVKNGLALAHFEESTHHVCVKLGTIDIASTPKATPTETLAFGLAQRLQYIVCLSAQRRGEEVSAEMPAGMLVNMGFTWAQARKALCETVRGRFSLWAQLTLTHNFRAGTQSAASSSYGREWIFEFKEALLHATELSFLLYYAVESQKLESKLLYVTVNPKTILNQRNLLSRAEPVYHAHCGHSLKLSRRFASDKATTTTGVTGDLDNGTVTTSATPIAEATASTSAMESR
ncbi:hypothetical protein EDB84DRAFT_1440801 [Lactarius hengduanensis]|nr:hypothetical protein EDB84DRAFT_1440801 [Lactarius hengduanensis]